MVESQTSNQIKGVNSSTLGALRSGGKTASPGSFDSQGWIDAQDEQVGLEESPFGRPKRRGVIRIRGGNL